jgi:two-component system response regulator AtoC
MAKVLIVGEEKPTADPLREMLVSLGHVPARVATAAQSLEALDQDLHELLVVDLQAPYGALLALVREVGKHWPELPIIVAWGGSTVAETVELIRAGVSDFLVQRFDSDEVRYVTHKALVGAAPLASQPPRMFARSESSLIGNALPMRELRETIGRVASAIATVLIRGESGTGKELVARAVHDESPRRLKPFVKVDCTSLPENLLESELFGYEKGAFTGAVSAKPGRVELANGGTLFLDEIGDISPTLQAKLLRLLQERQFDRIGSKHPPTRVDVRFLLATHRDLDTMVENKEFRADLFHRINVVQLWLPPLRSRRSDIELLALHFLAEFAKLNGRSNLTIEQEAMKLLRKQRWPGNVRQLENFVEQLVVLADGNTINAAQIERLFVQRPSFVTQSTTTATEASVQGNQSTDSALEKAARDAEAETLRRALQRTRGNRSAAARVLGVSRQTLYNKLKILGIEP